MGKGRRVKGKSYNSFVGMEVNSDSVGRLELQKKSHKPF
jgi:hypothetical protein